MITGNEFLEIISDYRKLSECIRTHTIDEIVSSASANTGIDTQTLCGYPIGCASREIEKGYSGYYHALKDLYCNIDRYDWLYNRLYDEESKRVFRLLIAFRFFPDIKFIKNAYDGEHPQYFDTSFVNCDKNEVFVDCGGYVGDTFLSYTDVYHDYKKYYIYEPSKENIEKINENLKDFHDIVVRKAGVGEKTETVLFSQNGSAGTFIDGNWTDEGEKTEIVSLDDDIKEPVTFIKMDIEGYEIPAIIGAKNHIVNDKPKLAICLYHVLSDMWEIPTLINTLLPDHRFYIRHYMENQNWETVLYAIPPEKRRKNELKTGVTIYSFPDRPWANSQLVKDCGLIPYLLHKNHSMETAMVGTSANIEDYPYAKYVEGMKLISLGAYDHETKLEYLAANAKDIDLLILYGGFKISAVFARVYKENNPNGIIYCGLDANSRWMDRLPWYKPDYKWFIKNCDVMTTSCTSMAELLTKKWHRKIEVALNGHYDLFDMKLLECAFKDKENVIFTASRLGTDQKATGVLLKAFAEIADKIPDWTLRLAGSVEDGFKAFIGQYYLDHPELKDRVIFLGEVTDKKVLAEEYKKAKIFALPSLWEGGVPNVIGEALLAGCVTAVGYIDAWADCIDNGRCGRAANAQSVVEYARCLDSLCHDERLEEMSLRAREYAKEKFDMLKIVEEIYGWVSEYAKK